MFLKRLFLSIVIVCFVAGGVVTVLVWQDETGSAQWQRSPEPTLARALGWKLSRNRNYQEEFRSMVARNPLAVFRLLTNDSNRIQRFAEKILSDREIAANLDNSILDKIHAELVEDSEFNKAALVRIMTSAGSRGISRLGSLYRDQTCVDPKVQREVCAQVAKQYRVGDALAKELLVIAADPSLRMENRSSAIEALGHMRKRERDAEEFKLYCAMTAAVQDTLSTFPPSKVIELRATWEQTEEEADNDRRRRDRRDERNYKFFPNKDGGEEAIAALSDEHDWWRVNNAALALADAGIERAIPALQQIADHYWYKPVRQTAAQAIRTIQGLPPLPAESTPSTKPAIAANPKKSGADYEFILFDNEKLSHLPKTLGEKITQMLRPAREIYFRLFQPKIDQVELQREGRLPLLMAINDAGMNEMRPRHAIPFAGGKLLGYDEGEFGAGTVFYRKGEIPKFFITPNVEDIIAMPFGPLVVCSTNLNEGILYLARAEKNGQVSVTLFQRLPGQPLAFLIRPSGDLFIACVGETVVVSPAGEIRMAQPADL